MKRNISIRHCLINLTKMKQEAEAANNEKMIGHIETAINALMIIAREMENVVAPPPDGKYRKDSWKRYNPITNKGYEITQTYDNKYLCKYYHNGELDEKVIGTMGTGIKVFSTEEAAIRSVYNYYTGRTNANA